VRDAILCRARGEVHVKGIQHAVVVYEVDGEELVAERSLLPDGGGSWLKEPSRRSS
jgi:hypothetical protein